MLADPSASATTRTVDWYGKKYEFSASASDINTGVSGRPALSTYEISRA